MNYDKPHGWGNSILAVVVAATAAALCAVIDALMEESHDPNH